MTIPDRPLFVKQLDGSRYAGLNCTCAAAAMALDRHTIGAHKTTGAYVRALTGDTSGGTTLAQVSRALWSRWSVSLDIQYAYGWDAFVARIKSGEGAILQGWEGVIRGTRWQSSETFSGNHAWFVNDVNADGFLVFNPLADGRRPGIAKSPMRIPSSVVREWAGKLNVAGPYEPYTPLGLGKVYAAFTRDTEPHVHLRSTARRTVPFPDRTRVNADSIAVRSGPGPRWKIIDQLHRDDLFVAYQETDNYLGSHGGKRWVLKSRVRGEGGTA